MALSDLDKLKDYMGPYYPSPYDETKLQDYLDEYGTPECAAAKLWNMLRANSTGGMGAIKELRDGSETTKFEDPSKIAEVIDKQAKYYTKQCNISKGFSTPNLINVKRNQVGGACYEPQIGENDAY